MADFCKHVPKDLEQNLQFRVDLLRRAAHDARFRAGLRTACRDDVLFWLNAFAFLYEPRPRRLGSKEAPKTIPFITWPHQDPVIRTMREKLGYEDVGLEKSRGEGASWILVLLALHDWLFKDLYAIGLVSKDEMSVDNPTNPDSLLWKVGWELTKLPKWMVPAYDRNISRHSFVNLQNGSTITGYPATADMGTGGRKAWFGFDELSRFKRPDDEEAVVSIQSVTDSRLFVSTPYGSEGAYYKIMTEPSAMTKLLLAWEANPTKNRGLYRWENGRAVEVDPVNNPLPPGYQEKAVVLLANLRKNGFPVEGRLRSPWYDNQCGRPRMTPSRMAREHDRDFGGSVERVFTASFIDAAKPYICQPRHRGVLSFDAIYLKPEWEREPTGPCLVWCALDEHTHRPPPHKYVVGADVAQGWAGRYSSNSVAEVIDLVTMEQVFECATNSVEPHDFADFVLAVCDWFYDAYLIWEVNGPGQAFTTQVLKRNYTNIYMRTSTDKMARRKGKMAGWHTSKNHSIFLGDFSRAVRHNEVRIHSEDLLSECDSWVYGATGDIECLHAGPSKTGNSHGDRVVAFGMAMLGVRDKMFGVTHDVAKSAQFQKDKCVPGTLAWRLKERDEMLAADADGWNDRTNADLARGNLSDREDFGPLE